MRGRTELVILSRSPVVVSGEQHCHNDCSFMQVELAGTYTASCTYFGEKLKWDKKCKYHGYLRCPQCIKRAVKE